VFIKNADASYWEGLELVPDFGSMNVEKAF